MRVDWNMAAQTHAMREGAVRRVATGQLVSVVQVRTEPKAEFDGRPHRHANEQWVVVTAGELRMMCADHEYVLTAGDLAYLPADAWHAALGVGATGATYLEFSAPPRLDLLPSSLVPSPLQFRVDG